MVRTLSNPAMQSIEVVKGMHGKRVGANAEGLLRRLAERGYQGRSASIERLPELKGEIQERFDRGSFDEEFYRSRLAFFDFGIPEALPDAKSMIVVAVPRPQAQATFTFRGERKGLIIPPTYVAYQRTTDGVVEFVADILREDGYKIARAQLPLKMLAVRSGLAEYGRNNITYIPGMGSFFQLVAVFSDMPCRDDAWREARMMKRCEGCQACQRSCPTGAISSDRFLLHAERCISFLNERKGDVPFPSWMDPSWHNCLYGCLRCQRVCPEDLRFMNWIVEKEEFSQAETELILKGQSLDRLPSATLGKLKNLDLADQESLDNLPRNLRVLL